MKQIKTMNFNVWNFDKKVHYHDNMVYP